MDTSKMRLEFENQLKDYAYKIKKGEEEIAKLKEYKLKLEGGLETLDLLDKPIPDVNDGSSPSQHTN
tara:strand:+ start:5816 stop:6016 length:201 start_codon:yes stop_codon:yes gene_type:complete